MQEGSTGNLRSLLEEECAIWRNLRVVDEWLVRSFVLRKSSYWLEQALPADFAAITKGNSFTNAQHMVIAKGLRYVEGFAIFSPRLSGVLFHHAWCLDDFNRVIDPTWSMTSAGASYFGVAFYTNTFSTYNHEPEDGSLLLKNGKANLPLIFSAAPELADDPFFQTLVQR